MSFYGDTTCEQCDPGTKEKNEEVQGWRENPVRVHVHAGISQIGTESHLSNSKTFTTSH